MFNVEIGGRRVPYANGKSINGGFKMLSRYRRGRLSDKGFSAGFFIILLHFQLTGSREIIRCCIRACPSRAKHGESAVMASGKINRNPLTNIDETGW